MAVGRLSALFNASDRGQVLVNFRSLPIASPVNNAVSGAVEYRLATFALQSMVALVLFIGLTVFYNKGQKRGKLRDGPEIKLGENERRARVEGEYVL